MNNICKDKDQPAENILHKADLQSELWAGNIRDVTMKQILCYERPQGISDLDVIFEKATKNI